MKLMIPVLAMITLPLAAFSQDSLNIQEIDSLRARTPPYKIEVKDETVVQRSFLEYENKVLDYVVSVGDPEGVHYAVNTFNGALIKAWRGEFLDGSLMWVWKARGIALAVPIGTEVKLGNENAFASADNAKSWWKDSLAPDEHYVFRGYDVDKQNRPTFRYEIDGVEVDDRITPIENKCLSRSLHFKGSLPKSFYHRIISGTAITRSSKNIYQVDKTFRIEVPQNTKVTIQQQGHRQLLIAQVTGDIQYNINW